MTLDLKIIPYRISPLLTTPIYGIETVADINALEDLYRRQLKASEEEAEIYRTSDVLTKLGLLKALRSSDESQNRNAPSSGKGRNVKRSLNNSSSAAAAAAALSAANLDLEALDSPGGPSPGDAPLVGISDKLKRVKTGPQRSASVASQASRSGDVSVRIDDGADGLNRGTNAEKAGQLVVGAEVMFKHNNKKVNGQQEGEGIQCVIKNVLENDKHGQRKKYVLFFFLFPSPSEAYVAMIPCFVEDQRT